MTIFSVEWPPEVLSDLADIWLNAPNRQAVTDAEAEIDRLLCRDPHTKGLHLSEGLYRLDVAPLVVTYTVDLTQHHVEVTSVYTTF
jgi:hypothetical protein